MITHRVTTKVAPEPSVGFYRTIAVSFLVVTLVLLGIIIFFTSKKATIVVVAKTDSKNISLDIDVEKQKTSDLSIAGFVTTTQLAWSQKYFPTGNKTIAGLAGGMVTLHNDTAAAQTLVKTTRLLTASGVLFHLSDRVSIPANGKVDASVYADQPGASGNIPPSKFTIPGLKEDKQKVIYADSAKEMSSGVRTSGVLTADDLKSAESDYVEKVKQQVDSALAPNATFAQKLVFVPNHSVIADHKAGDEVTEFNLSGTSTAVVVFYNTDDLKSVLEREISNRVDVSTEKVMSVTKDPQVTLASYDLDKHQARFSVYQDVQVTLDSNADKLMPANFFGKSQAEIERYIFGLGHVVGVDVKFSPSWVRGAPTSADKIQVIVKNVQ